jgi:secreted trypsin-like serine protease
MKLSFLGHLNDVKVNAMIGENVKLVEQGKFRFAVSILRVRFDNNQRIENHFCTGALISIKDVLTAEHCMINEILSQTYVTIGSVDFRHGTKYEILWWISYDQWARYKVLHQNFKNNDITIIRVINTL